MCLSILIIVQEKNLNDVHIQVFLLTGNMKELELKLIATNKELKKYRILTKINYERFKDYQNDDCDNCQCSREIKELKTCPKSKDEDFMDIMKKMELMEKLDHKFIATNKELGFHDLFALYREIKEVRVSIKRGMKS